MFYCFCYSRRQVSWFSGVYQIQNLWNYRSEYEESLKIYHGLC